MTTETTRAEHLAWCKTRALEYLDHEDKDQALTSMLSDLGKHEETKDHHAIQLGVLMKMNGFLNDHDEMRKFILGFN